MTYHFISDDPEIVMYVEKMAKWIEMRSGQSPQYIQSLFIEKQDKIKGLFESYPETIFHEDPEKWAELLATNWGLIKKQELVFV